jgi:hypothetical protein
LDIILLGSSNSLHRAGAAQAKVKARETVLQICETTELFSVVRPNGSGPEYGRKFCADVLACALECGRHWIIYNVRLRFPDLKCGSKKASTSSATVATLIGIANQRVRSKYSPVFNLLDPLLGPLLNQVSALSDSLKNG